VAKAKLAIGSWAYCFGPYESHPHPLPEVVQKLSDLKFDGIELCGFPPHATPEAYPDKAKRQELVKMIQDAGLEVCGYAADFTAVPPAVEPYCNGPYLERFKQCVEMCVDVGSPSIRVDTVSSPPLPEGVDYDTAWKRIVEQWQQAAEIAKDAGVLVVWEFEPGFMFNKPSEIVKMYEDVGHENFKILLDTCHAQMVAVVGARQAPPKETLDGGILELIGMLNGKIGHVHLIDSDNTLHDEETSTHRPFGEGFINFDEVIPAIINAGYTSQWWSIDLCFWPEAWEVTENAKKFLEPLLEKYVG